MGRPAAAASPETKYSFSGHETFTFRYTWLPKVARHLPGRTDLFVADDALAILGVGKNMIRSIKYWCEATGVIRRGGGRGNAKMASFGDRLLSPEGWDPYLEDPGTLWLLHWQLVKNPSRSSTWHLAFTRWPSEHFTTDQLTDWLERLIANEQPSTRATTASLRRDVEVFIRTYVSPRTGRDLPLEDTFDCPLVELGLVQEQEGGGFGFTRGPKPTLPDEIFVYALMNFWNREAQQQSALSFERILYGAGSPGGAFRLSENALAERLERLPDWVGLDYDETSGLRVVLRRGHTADEKLQPTRALERYYGKTPAGVGV